MGQAISINDITTNYNNNKQTYQEQEPISQQQPKSTSMRSSSISRSHSHQSLSQLSNNTNISTMSTISTVSMSDKFVSFENTLINIPANKYINTTTPNLSNINTDYTSEWQLNIVNKYTFNDEIMNMMNNDQNENDDIYLCVVFGICDKSLLNVGYKHRYYGYGYSVTYCKGYKFQSFATRFKKSDDIKIRYNKSNGQISFYCNNIQNKQIIRIDATSNNVITIKSYDDAYDVQVVQNL